jgi:hypothetical protein
MSDWWTMALPPDRRRIAQPCEHGGLQERRLVDIKKVAVLASVLLLLFFLITQPQQSAALVNQILDWLKDSANALITFVKNLFA